MKILKRTVAVIVVLLLAVKLSPYEYLIKGVKNTYLKGYTSAHLYDREYFDQREIPVVLPKKLAVSDSVSLTIDDELRGPLERVGTKGMLVLQNDEIVYEEYWDQHDTAAVSNSFSTAKIGHYPSYPDCCSRRLHRFLGRSSDGLHPGI